MKKALPLLLFLLYPSLALAFNVTLNWQDNSTNESGFKIQTAPTCTVDSNGNATSGTFVDSFAVGANITTFADPNGTPGECYRVYAFNSAGNSGFSNVGIAQTVPGAPSNLKLSFAGSGTLAANWNDNSNNELNFKLTTVGTTPPRTYIDYPPANSTSYVIYGLQKNKAYCATIIAVGAAGNSQPSNQACAST